MTALNFNAREVSPSQSLDPVPAGWYPVTIVESEMKPTKDQTGQYLYLVMKIMDGPFAGRQLFDRLNLQNNNQQAVEIAYRTLSAICHAVGVLDLQDSMQLHGHVFEARASVRQAGTGPNGQQYDAQNEIKGYRAIGSGETGSAPVATMPAAGPAPVPTATFVRPAAAPSAAPAPASTAAPSPGAAPAPSSTPPWLRKPAA